MSSLAAQGVPLRAVAIQRSEQHTALTSFCRWGRLFFTPSLVLSDLSRLNVSVLFSPSLSLSLPPLSLSIYLSISLSLSPFLYLYLSLSLSLSLSLCPSFFLSLSLSLPSLSLSLSPSLSLSLSVSLSLSLFARLLSWFGRGAARTAREVGECLLDTHGVHFLGWCMHRSSILVAALNLVYFKAPAIQAPGRKRLNAKSA